MYHPWSWEYHKIITREKHIKSMTKDPYTPITQFISYAVEVLITEAEYCSTLIPAKAVNIRNFNIQQAPKLSRKFMLLLFFLIII